MKNKLRKVLDVLRVRKTVVAIVTTVLIVAGAFGLKVTDNEAVFVEAIVVIAEAATAVLDASEAIEVI